MTIRWRKNETLLCATQSNDDTYINDRLHYQLSIISKTIKESIKKITLEQTVVVRTIKTLKEKLIAIVHRVIKNGYKINNNNKTDIINLYDLPKSFNWLVDTSNDHYNKNLKALECINVVLPKLTDLHVHLWNVQADETLCGINCFYALKVNNFVTCPECLKKWNA